MQGCPLDQAADGVTNPAPIAANPYGGNAAMNTTTSALGTAGSSPSYSAGSDVLTTPYAADDDGGFFRWKDRQYYATGAAPIASGAGGAASSTAAKSSCGLGGLAGLLATIMIGAAGALKRRERSRQRDLR